MITYYKGYYEYGLPKHKVNVIWRYDSDVKEMCFTEIDKNIMWLRWNGGEPLKYYKDIIREPITEVEAFAELL